MPSHESYNSAYRSHLNETSPIIRHRRGGSFSKVKPRVNDRWGFIDRGCFFIAICVELRSAFFSMRLARLKIISAFDMAQGSPSIIAAADNPPVAPIKRLCIIFVYIVPTRSARRKNKRATPPTQRRSLFRKDREVLLSCPWDAPAVFVAIRLRKCVKRKRYARRELIF